MCVCACVCVCMCVNDVFNVLFIICQKKTTEFPF